MFNMFGERIPDGSSRVHEGLAEKFAVRFWRI